MQCDGTGFTEKGHKSKSYLMCLFELVSMGFAYLHDTAHVHLIKSGKHGGFIFCRDQSFGNSTAQAAHFFCPLFAAEIPGRTFIACLRRGRSRRPLGFLRILFRYASIPAGAGYICSSNSFFF
jgi:hypothetical protein